MKRLLTAILAAWLSSMSLAGACDLRVPLHPVEVRGTVIGESPPEETERQTEIATRITGGAPARRYMSFPRIIAEFRDQVGSPHRVISAVTDGTTLAPGSAVVLLSRYLDPEDSCHFIPWTVKPLGRPS